MRVFLTGGTGVIGTRLVRALTQRGDQVVLLTRRPEFGTQLGCEVVAGDPMKPGPWQDAASDCDAIVNLFGENVMGHRWSEAYKRLLRESRVLATTHCVEALLKKPRRLDGSLKVLVNASAIGWYGARGDEELDETSETGHDFLASICQDWENSTRPAAAAGIRTVLLRIGVVLDSAGGPLTKLLTPFKFGLGGPVGSGKQFFSWVHHSDVVGLILFALDKEAVSGPLNASAPDPRTNKDFGKALGRALRRPSFFWTPGFMLKLMLGQGAEIIVTGQRVLPKKALSLGYSFQFPNLDQALADLLK